MQSESKKLGACAPIDIHFQEFTRAKYRSKRAFRLTAGFPQPRCRGAYPAAGQSRRLRRCADPVSGLPAACAAIHRTGVRARAGAAAVAAVAVHFVEMALAPALRLGHCHRAAAGGGLNGACLLYTSDAADE